MTTPENTGESAEDILTQTAKILFEENPPSPNQRSGLHIVYSIPSREADSRQLVIEIQSREDIDRILHHLSNEERHAPPLTPINSEALKEIDSRQIDRAKPIRNDPNALIGRNDRCACGSGKKFKRCCGAPK